jgi:hypothetical protein
VGDPKVDLTKETTERTSTKGGQGLAPECREDLNGKFSAAKRALKVGFNGLNDGDVEVVRGALREIKQLNAELHQYREWIKNPDPYKRFCQDYARFRAQVNAKIWRG